ncbi:uncharacterized protein [Rutidosis leptorrhynchoides]|uniref:uncharacterized protein n=1 Tax=Rutidosis leptorrhynchoides TaxID=125765 RepID=UPI003A9956EF
MEDSMLDMPHMAFDEKTAGSKRVRDGEEETRIGRLEKRPSGILGVINIEDYNDNNSSHEVAGNGNGGGIIDTIISNVFHKNENGEEKESDREAKNDVLDIKDEDKIEELGVGNVENGGGEGGEAGGNGGGIINTFFSNIFQNNNGSANGYSDQAKSDLLNEVTDDKIEDLGGGGGELDGHINEEKLVEKNDAISDLPNKDPEEIKLKMRPDDYSERVFFLNNN